MGNGALSLLAAAFPKFRDLLLAMAAVGISIDEFQDHPNANLLSEDPMYTIKFSIPEFWELGILGDGKDIDGENLKKDFKASMNDAMIEMWKHEDEDFDDDFGQECLKYIQYMCRVRKGEIWTAAMRDFNINKTQSDMAKVDAYLQAQQGYTEV